MAKTIEETWPLVSADTTAIVSAGRHDGTASKWNDIWEYQVPSGQAHILKAEHTFSIYVDDTGGEATAGKARIWIVYRDQSKQDEQTILTPTVYEACKDFNDKAKILKLNLPGDLVIEERFWIVIKGYSDQNIDESDSYFILETIRIRSGI